MSTTQRRLPEAIIPNLAQIIAELEGEVLFQISLDELGEVVDIECLASASQPKNMLPLDLLLARPRDLQAASVLYVSNGSGSIDPPNECDIDFTTRLIEAGAAARVPVTDHYLVGDDRILSLRSATSLWR